MSLRFLKLNLRNISAILKSAKENLGKHCLWINNIQFPELGQFKKQEGLAVATIVRDV